MKIKLVQHDTGKKRILSVPGDFTSLYFNRPQDKLMWIDISDKEIVLCFSNHLPDVHSHVPNPDVGGDTGFYTLT